MKLFLLGLYTLLVFPLFGSPITEVPPTEKPVPSLTSIMDIPPNPTESIDLSKGINLNLVVVPKGIGWTHPLLTYQNSADELVMSERQRRLDQIINDAMPYRHQPLLDVPEKGNVLLLVILAGVTITSPLFLRLV